MTRFATANTNTTSSAMSFAEACFACASSMVLSVMGIALAVSIFVLSLSVISIIVRISLVSIIISLALIIVRLLNVKEKNKTCYQ